MVSIIYLKVMYYVNYLLHLAKLLLLLNLLQRLHQYVDLIINAGLQELSKEFLKD